MNLVFKQIYNNKLTDKDFSLVAGLVGMLPFGVFHIDLPLTVLSDEEITDSRFESPYDFEWMGYYVPEERKIVLLRNAILKVSNKLDIPEEVLRAIVFAHELGHYYTHCLPLWDTKSYNTELFNDTSIDVLEGWAQLFAFWAVKSNPEDLYYFNTLVKHQSAPYKVFEQYSERSIDQLLHSLDHLRALPYPATLRDWV